MSAQLITSKNDNKIYQHITLVNGLEVLLIQNEQSHESAASMAVGAGHFHDPKSHLGLGHCLEHMLFLGSQDFPKQDDFQEFIQNNGGQTNAWTGQEEACFHFVIQSDDFDGALHRFAALFRAPLLSAPLIEKEVQAITSEYSLKLKDGGRRLLDVIKSTCNPAHPFAQFSVGNQQTLLADGVDALHKALELYHQTHYVAKNMRLCLQSPLPIAQQIALVQRHFLSLSAHAKPAPLKPVPLFNPIAQPTLIEVEGISDKAQLILSFALPSDEKLYQHKLLNFFSHILGHEAKATFGDFMVEQGYTAQVSVGSGLNCYNHIDFNISMPLTSYGLTQITEIIEQALKAIALLQQKGLYQWRYQERAQLFENTFNFLEEGSIEDTVNHLSVNMLHYPKDEIIHGDYRMDGLDIELANLLLDKLSPENMRVMVVKRNIEASETSRWYHTPYRVSHFSAEQRQRFTQARAADSWPFSLPKPNLFLGAIARPPIHKPDKRPEKIHQDYHFSLWHQYDTEFQSPKGYLYLNWISAAAHHTARASAMTRLYIQLLIDALQPITYDAQVAGLFYRLSTNQKGIMLTLSGFAEKQHELLTLITQWVQENDIDTERFERIKQSLHQSWQSQVVNKPINLVIEQLTHILQPTSYPKAQLAFEVESVSYQELQTHIRELFKDMQFDGLIYGDWDDNQAIEVAFALKTQLARLNQFASPTQLHYLDVHRSGMASQFINHNHHDDAVAVYYQAPTSQLKDVAQYQLLSQILQGPMFNELRTNQQLGYLVGVSYFPVCGHAGLIFYLQSDSHNSHDIIAALDRFIASASTLLDGLTPEQFQQIQSGLMLQIQKPDSNLKARAAKTWSAISHKDIHFDRAERLVQSIQQITIEGLKELIENHINPAHARLVVSTQDEHAPAINQWEQEAYFFSQH